MVKEKTIEQIMEQLAQESSSLEEHYKIIEEEQAAIYHWLISENFDILTIPEKDHLLYVAMVILKACKHDFEDLPNISPQEIERTEEENWEIFLSTKGKFRDRLTTFFDNFPQEDLLAFVEDAVSIDEEEEVITQVGREIIFVSMKSLIDLLIK